jgi:hypothetical protein
MIKIIYIVIVIFYFLFFIVYLFKSDVIYTLFKVNPNLIKIRSLTREEFYALEAAHKLIRQIPVWFMIISFVVAIISGIINYFDLIEIKHTVKFIFKFSLIAAIILFIIDGINFIPMPPIR